MEFFITDSGDLGRITKRFRNMSEEAQHTKPVMRLISLDMMEVEKAVFNSKGRRGGGSWKKLKLDTVKKKGTAEILKTDGSNPNYSSLGPNNTLFKSLTEENALYQISDVGDDHVEFGTSRPYANVHQDGHWMRGIPARPFLRFTANDTTRWANMIESHLMRGFANEA